MSDLKQDYQLESALREKFAEEVVGVEHCAGQETIYLRRDNITQVFDWLLSDLGFEMLLDVTAVDYLNQGRPERFVVVYNLFSITRNERVRFAVYVPETDPILPTASGHWKLADWGERETFDMYGIKFEGHPNLERILMPDDYSGHPLRKDYPLRGRGERENFPKWSGEGEDAAALY